MDYSHLSRDQLIARLQQFESSSKHPRDTPSPSVNKKQKQKHAKEFDFTTYPTRFIALFVQYVGTRYHGLASQGLEHLDTVESALFRALRHVRLVDPNVSGTPEGYTRCGRTDRGVHAAKQVVSLRVRSNGETKEIAYVDVINRQLPEDVRVLAWAPVQPEFNARFDCIWREYRYYFPHAIRPDLVLDTEAMREAAGLFVGEHDFRNFCKVDRTKPADMNFVRCVMECEIIPADSTHHALRLKGSGFLWHQVRCMMAILFRVGQGLESPQVVEQLLDIQQYPARPAYEMASEAPLVLHDCGYILPLEGRFGHAPLEVQQSVTSRASIDLLVKSSLGHVATALTPPRDHGSAMYLGAGQFKKYGHYTHLIDLNTCMEHSVRSTAWHQRQQKS